MSATELTLLDRIVYIFQACGWLYTILLFCSTLIVFLTAVPVVILARSRRPLWILAMWCFLPLMLGVFGTIHGYVVVQRIGDMTLGGANSEELAVGFAASRMTTYVGATCTLLLLLLPLIAIACRGLFGMSRAEALNSDGAT